MNKNIPKTKEECFAQLDVTLSEEDKKALQEADDLVLCHFSLGMWIRNNWIYQMSDEDKQSFMKMFAEEESQNGFYFFHPDDVSEEIIEKYVEHLKGKTDDEL